MIGYLKGELIDIKENYIVLEVGNIGYEKFSYHPRPYYYFPLEGVI